MSEMADKVRRRMNALDLNQTRLAEISGISQGIISQLLNGKQGSLSPENLRRLSEALQVPVVYWLSDSIRQFAAARVAEARESENWTWEELPPHERVKWVLEDIEACWGPEHGIDALSRLSRVSKDSLLLMFEGRINLTPNVLKAVSDLTGLPASFFASDQIEVPDGIPKRYTEIGETAFTLGLDPDYVTEMLVLLSRQPCTSPPIPIARKEKEPGP